MSLFVLTSAALLAATASATSDAYAFNLNDAYVPTIPGARIVNNCGYTVNIWSVVKGQDCEAGKQAVVQPGGRYNENFRPAVSDGKGGSIATSIKISKTDNCRKGVSDIVQLEYMPEKSDPKYAANFLDVSYVDCTGRKCPTADEGYYLKSGNEDGKFLKNSVNEICPIFDCKNFDDCAKNSYVMPDDRQTKSCSNDANLDFYLCGKDGKSGNNNNNNDNKKPKSSASQAAPSAPTPSAPAPVYSAINENKVNVANAPQNTPAPQPQQAQGNKKVKTVVEYVTQVVQGGYPHKRHEHRHRHQHFRA